LRKFLEPAPCEIARSTRKKIQVNYSTIMHTIQEEEGVSLNVARVPHVRSIYLLLIQTLSLLLRAMHFLVPIPSLNLEVEDLQP